MARTLYHRLADQIATYGDTELPGFVAEMTNRMNAAAQPSVAAPQTHRNRMAQSDHGHDNPGPGRAKKLYGRK